MGLEKLLAPLASDSPTPCSDNRTGFSQAWLEEYGIGLLQAELEEPTCSCVGFLPAEGTPYEESSAFSSHGPLVKSR